MSDVGVSFRLCWQRQRLNTDGATLLKARLDCSEHLPFSNDFEGIKRVEGSCPAAPSVVKHLADWVLSLPITRSITFMEIVDSPLS